MSTAIHQSLDQDAPPATLTRPQQALWWLKKGGLEVGPEWERAHDIVQSAEGDRAHDAVHALVHLVEGDVSNADYWARRAGAKPGVVDKIAEWERLAAAAGAEAGL